MKIGVDISQIVYHGTGVSRFTEGFVQSVLKYNSGHEWVFFFSSLRKKIDPSLKYKIENSQHKLHTFSFPPSLLSFIFNDLHKYSKLVTCNLELFTDLDWFITSDWIELPLPVKKATIVHDLVFKKHPETVHPQIIKTQEKRLKLVSQESTIIFADSQTTASDLRQKYNIDTSKIVLNYPGVEVYKVLSQADQNKHLNTYKITKPYILSVGKNEPRKNLPRLISAFQKLKYHNNISLQFVIVGPEGWSTSHKPQDNNIRFLGYVTDDILATLYSNAIGFIYPSIYEGFGYPIIEAMKYGCPVAVSNISSLPEIAGGAALLFNPYDISSIQKAIDYLINSQDFRSNIIKKGFDQSRKFTWEKYYNILVDALEHNNT